MGSTRSSAVIRPGATVLDDRGVVAQLHGVGIQRVGDRYWAWGEDKRAGSTFTAVAAYSSDDLATWRFEGDALTAIAGHASLSPEHIVERPKVLYNEATRTYVMYLHLDTQDYAAAQIGIAVAPAPAGPFEFLRAERPLGNISRDIGVYEEAGTAYLLSEDRDHGLHIYRLSPDYTRVEEIVSTTLKKGTTHGYESPTVVRHGDVYYLFGSDLTGWSANDNKYATARSLTGPWSDWRDFAPAGSATFDSQVSVVVPVETPSGPRYVYVGDRWLKDDLEHSPLVVLPLVIDEDGARVEWKDTWSLTDLS